MMRKARKIRKHLDASDNLTEPVWRKPKGMHQQSFDRLVEKEAAASEAVNIAMADKIGLLKQLGWL